MSKDSVTHVSAMTWLSATTLAVLLATGASVSLRDALSLQALPSATQLPMIPGTEVPMPEDYEDYARSRKPIRLFPGKAPGKRDASPAVGPGLPAFDPARPALSKEAFIDASPLDPIGHRCAPGGDAAGHYFYNVWDPEIVPFLVNRSSPNFQDAAIIIAPGGGSIHLAWEPEGLAAAEKFNKIGISAFVLKYRVPDHTGLLQLADAQRAVSYVRKHAARYGVNASRIGFMGSSAGGALGMKLGYPRERAYTPFDDVDNAPFGPDFLILLYPGIVFDKPGKIAGLPPTFLAFADDDHCCLAASAQGFVRLAKANMKQPLVVQEYEHGHHGWGDCDYYPQLRGLPNCDWFVHAQEFLKATVLRK